MATQLAFVSAVRVAAATTVAIPLASADVSPLEPPLPGSAADPPAPPATASGFGVSLEHPPEDITIVATLIPWHMDHLPRLPGASHRFLSRWERVSSLMCHERRSSAGESRRCSLEHVSRAERGAPHTTWNIA
jgi:hypothetical protein